ncbi:MAG TPA: hypothetical protein PKE27_12960 [Povalibacter sp.]|uniref:DUF6600 domain-containing protein n=1 Tax=Povalibacter sp. TaxID=1962978 RepID=UPI002BF63B17|nr:DUF6600 domain-containing protein [Povalibacter sp.]HMN45486.1 hypothetical protein [Povalibacter sp.]
MRSLLLLCLLSLSCASLAEEVADAPGRVARLGLIEGEVTLAPAGTEEWAEAVLNRPLTNGDRLFVENGGRAELQVGSSKIHLDQGTGLSIIELDDDVMRLELSEGSAVVRVLRRRDNERIEVETPNATVDLRHPGEYRIDANPAGDRTVVAVRSGGSEVIADGKSWRVDDGEEGTFTGTGQLGASIVPLGARTAFEDWANDRNRVAENSESARYVSNEVIGYEDLDRHGRWINEPTYGYVWTPSYVAAGWAPYRYGRWVWVSPWGWSWVDNSPWGFAPFHYGRWAYVSSRWCWVPGPRHIRPVYAPALVAWAGSPGVSVSVGIGPGVGWFPLGPREVYVPGYRYSRRYLNNVNVSNTVIVNNTFITHVYNGRNRHFDYRYGRDPRAVTIVDRDRFRGGGNLDGHWSRVDQNDLRRWHHDPRPPALAPNRDSVFAARTLGRIPGSADHVVRQTFDQRNRAADTRRPARISFDAEQRAIEANGGRPIPRSQLRAGATGNLAAPGRLQTRPDGDGPREQQWRADRQRAGSTANPAAVDRTQQPRPERSDLRREREAAIDARDQWRSSDRPAVTRRETPQRTEVPAVNSLQQGSAPARSVERTREQPRQWRGNDAQDRLRRNAEPREQPRSWQSSGDAQPRQRSESREPPRAQPQPRVEQPRSQQRQEQPSLNRGNQERASRPQAGNDNNAGRSSRPESGGRPNFRQQER